jgi:hypothetical protein
VRGAVEDDVLVHLVRQHEEVMLVRKLRERIEIAGVEHRTAGIVRRVDEDHARLRRDRGGDAIPVGPERARIERDMHGAAAVEFDRRFVAVVARVEHDDFVARTHDGGDRREQRLGRAGRHRDFGIGIDLAAVELLGLARDRLAQRRHAGHRRVLVASFRHRARERIAQRGRAVEIGKALAEIDGLVLDRELAHHREDRRPDLRQLGFDLHVAFAFGRPNSQNRRC